MFLRIIVQQQHLQQMCPEIHQLRNVFSVRTHAEACSILADRFERHSL